MGRVSQIGEDDGSLFKDVIVEPSCDFSLLDKVFVIKALSEKLE